MQELQSINFNTDGTIKSTTLSPLLSKIQSQISQEPDTFFKYINMLIIFINSMQHNWNNDNFVYLCSWISGFIGSYLFRLKLQPLQSNGIYFILLSKGILNCVQLLFKLTKEEGDFRIQAKCVQSFTRIFTNCFNLMYIFI